MNKLISFFAFHYLVGKVFTIHYMLIYSRMTLIQCNKVVYAKCAWIGYICFVKKSEKIEIGNILIIKGTYYVSKD